jgi:hypothetical protein
MKFRILAGAMLALAPVAAVAGTGMPVSTFLAKADKLQSKGPLAMFSGDLKLLMGQIKTDAAQLRAENRAAEAAGKPKAYCTAPGGVRMSNRDILSAMNAIPPAQRARTSTKDALRGYFARRFPCPAKA